MTTVGGVHLRGDSAGRQPTRAQAVVPGTPTAVGPPPSVAPGPGPGAEPAVRSGAVPAERPETPARGRRRTAALVAVVAVPLAAVVALGVLLLRTDRRAARTADQADDAAGRLLALTLPSNVDADACTVVETSGSLPYEVRCGATSDGAGPTIGRYTMATGDTAAEALTADLAARYLRELSDVYECGSGDDRQGWAPVTDRGLDGEDAVVGRVACWVDDDGDSVLSWAWPDTGTRAVVELRGGGPSGLSTLRSWWLSTADRGY